MKYYIYTLSKGKKGIFYVGLTKDIKTRTAAHKNKHGKNVIFTVIDSCFYSDAFNRERYWIDKYKKQGIKLANRAAKDTRVQQVRVTVRAHSIAVSVACSKQTSVRDYVSKLIINDFKMANNEKKKSNHQHRSMQHETNKTGTAR